MGRARERRLRAAAEPARAAPRRCRRRSPSAGGGALVEIRSITDAERARDAGAIDRSRRVRRAARGAAAAAAEAAGAARAGRRHWLLDLPTLTADDPPVLLRLAVFANPWPGPVAIWRSFDGADASSALRWRWRRRSSARRSTICRRGRRAAGTGRAACACDCTAARSRRSPIRRCSTAPMPRRCSGRTAPGRCCNSPMPSWSASAPMSCRVCCAGRWAANGRWTIRLPAGAPFVLLDQHVVPIARGLESLGRAMQLRVVAADRDHGDPAAVDAQRDAAGDRAEAACAGASCGASAAAAGVTFSWVRRKRGPMPASWDVDVPLGEDERRPTSSTSCPALRWCARSRQRRPSVLYAAADEITDFGSAQASLRCAPLPAVRDRRPRLRRRAVLTI